MKSLKLKSPAKINLFLKILGKKDGYHQLESLMAFLDLYDEIEVSLSQNFEIKFSKEFGDKIDKEKNIFIEILDYFAKNFGISKNILIDVKKNIPVAAGLGGGSSNGATFIKILNELFNLNLSKKELQKISLNFGSDIAFFFEDEACIIKGRGDIIENFEDFKPIEILLINPKIPLSTKDVFAEFAKNYLPKIDQSNSLLREHSEFEPKLGLDIENDLTKPAISILPEIKIILDELEKQDAKINKMSGSGATCFGIFANEEKLDFAFDYFRKKFPNFFVIKTKILSNVKN